MPVLRTCQYVSCQKAFFVKPSWINKGEGKFCSKACAYISRRTTISYACVHCGKGFTRQPSYQGTAEFCSRRCRADSILAARPPLEDIFWSQVQPCAHGLSCPYCCWPWKGLQNKQGYGRLYLGQEKVVIASRIAWEIGNQRPLPRHRDAAHYCNNPVCCNFFHIYAGTRHQNVQDAICAGTHISVVRHNAHVLRSTREGSEETIPTTGGSAR